MQSVLLLYGLHPVDLKTGVVERSRRPVLPSSTVEMSTGKIDDEGMVTLRMEGNSEGCGSSAATLKLAVVKQSTKRHRHDGNFGRRLLEKAAFVPLARAFC